MSELRYRNHVHGFNVDVVECRRTGFYVRVTFRKGVYYREAVPDAEEGKRIAESIACGIDLRHRVKDDDGRVDWP